MLINSLIQAQGYSSESLCLRRVEASKVNPNGPYSLVPGSGPPSNTCVAFFIGITVLTMTYGIGMMKRLSSEPRQKLLFLPSDSDLAPNAKNSGNTTTTKEPMSSGWDAIAGVRLQSRPRTSSCLRVAVIEELYGRGNHTPES